MIDIEELLDPRTGQLNFVANVASGRVHVLVGYGPYHRMFPRGELEDVVRELLPYIYTLCGQSFLDRDLVGGNGSCVGEFPDEAICHACVRKLGGDSHYAFEHDQPEGVTMRQWVSGLSELHARSPKSSGSSGSSTSPG